MEKLIEKTDEDFVVQRSKFDANNKLIILDEPIIRKAGEKVVKVKNNPITKIHVLDVLKPLKAFNILVAKDSQGLYTIKHYGHVLTYISETRNGCSIYKKINGNWKAIQITEKNELSKTLSELQKEIKKNKNNGLKPIEQVIKELEEKIHGYTKTC